MKINHLHAACLTAAGALILCTAGCHHDNDARPEESMVSKMEIHDTNRLADTQSAAGARDDSTLYPQHFDGPDLSSLGVNKLDLMLADSHSCNPLVVYLAIPDNQYGQDRRLAVGRYLANRGGLKPSQIEFQDGPEPSTYTPADPNLKNYDKTDTSISSSASGSGSSGSYGSSSSSH